jgi:hypothetical protein
LDRILALLKTRLDFHVHQLATLPTTTSSPPMPTLKLVEGEASLVADPTSQVVKTAAIYPTSQPAPPPRHWPPMQITVLGCVVVAVLGSAQPSVGSAALCGPKARPALSPSAPTGTATFSHVPRPPTPALIPPSAVAPTSTS